MARKNKVRHINANNPLISILTPTYNRPDWLKMTLQSLIEQTYPSWECIVVNDAGEDVSHVVEGFNDSRIKYFVNEKNLDLAGSRNVAISKAQGDWFVMLDDDDGLMPEALEFRMWRAKKLNAEIVYSRVLQCFYEKGFNNEYKYLGEKVYWDSVYDPDLILLQNVAPCNGIMFSRKAQEAGGLFDTSLKTGEDWDHSISMSRHFPFFETKIIDAYCSFRTSNEQMTGTRDFSTDIAKIFKKWRHTAKNKDWIVANQNRILESRNVNPADYGL